jgi:hypothetical protein
MAGRPTKMPIPNPKMAGNLTNTPIPNPKMAGNLTKTLWSTLDSGVCVGAYATFGP